MNVVHLVLSRYTRTLRTLHFQVLSLSHIFLYPSEDRTSLRIVLQLPIDPRVLPVRVASMFKVLVPTVLEKQGAQLLVVAVLVLYRTWISDRISSLNGTTVKYVLEQDKASFVRLSVLQSAASSFVALSLRWSEDNASMFVDAETIRVEKLFKDEATEEKGVRTKMASFVGAMVIADLVKMTLGPKVLAKLVENLGEGIENGTRDQHFDSLLEGCEVASDIYYNVDLCEGCDHCRG
ncbi:ABC transporter D family member 1 isoform X2 [Tanacetum coccineum]